MEVTWRTAAALLLILQGKASSTEALRFASCWADIGPGTTCATQPRQANSDVDNVFSTRCKSSLCSWISNSLDGWSFILYSRQGVVIRDVTGILCSLVLQLALLCNLGTLANLSSMHSPFAKLGSFLVIRIQCRWVLVKFRDIHQRRSCERKALDLETHLDERIRLFRLQLLNC